MNVTHGITDQYLVTVNHIFEGEILNEGSGSCLIYLMATLDMVINV